MSLTITGGWYEEICGEPHWHEFYGPGGRAAAALSGRNLDIRLLTYCPPDLQSKLGFFAKSFGFQVFPHGTAPAITRFQYLHWLRAPQISSGSATDGELPAIQANDAENAIRYGFYEGDAVTKAKRAVYDPQNAPERVRAYAANGSSAEQLALVCNFAEAAKLSNETSPDRILDALLQIPTVVSVAVKGAWEGVWVATLADRALIKPTPTAHVHKVGTGDVFTAEFGYGWMILGLDPIEAARRASLQVAAYTNSASLPIPESASVTPAPCPVLPSRDGTRWKYDVYVAGPFFNHAQLSVVEEMTNLFRDAGLFVFSPYHDVGLGKATHVAKQDLDALRHSRMVVACLDGCDPGTIFEVGFARALDIPVLIYSPNLSDLNSTMFVGSKCEVSRDFTTAIYRAVWWAKST